jgi:transcriptional repressor NrdR
MPVVRPTPDIGAGGVSSAVRCPFCHHPDSRVIDSRDVDEGKATRRRRSCPECGRRFTTVEEAVLAVVKRSGVTEPFSRE